MFFSLEKFFFFSKKDVDNTVSYHLPSVQIEASSKKENI